MVSATFGLGVGVLIVFIISLMPPVGDRVCLFGAGQVQCFDVKTAKPIVIPDTQIQSAAAN